MADDLKNRGPADRTRVSGSEEWELRYWSDKFGVSVERLQEAIKQVGSSAAALEAHFKK